MTRDAEMFDPQLRATSLAVVQWRIAAICLVTLALPHDKDVHDVQILVVAGRADRGGRRSYGASGERFDAPRDRRLGGRSTTVLDRRWLNFAAGTTAGFGLFFGLTVVYAFYFLDLPLRAGSRRRWWPWPT